MSGILLVCAVLLSGCATYRETYLPDGSRGYSISCDGAMQSIASCLEKAGDICGARGYRVFDRSGQAIPMGSLMATPGQLTGFMGAAVFRNLLIGCGTGPTTAPGAQAAPPDRPIEVAQRSPAAAPPSPQPGGIEGEFRLASRVIPLPPGSWRVLHTGRRQGRTDGGSGSIQTNLHDVVLVQERQGRAAGIVVATTAAEPGVTWGPFGICQGTALLRTIASAVQRNVDCQGVSRWAAAFTAGTPAYLAALYAEAGNRPGWLPPFWIAVSYAFSNDNDYISVQYRFDPAVFAPAGRQNASVWATGLMAPAEQQFVERLGDWMAGARPMVRDGYRGRSAGGPLRAL